MDNRKRNIVIAIMVAMFLGAVEGTVVTTAVPTIVKALNGFELISWVFSLYLLTSAISTPIYGKLSDLYGRKNTLSAGIIIFLLGSSLCGISQNMYQLIFFRAIQGLGAGAIFTVTYTIVGDVFSLAERAKVQGWVSSVWGISSLAGPFLGGFLIDTLSWHWVFFINIPFGIISIILLRRNLKEDYEVKRHKIDFAGTLALSAAIVVLMYGILSGKKGSGIYSPSIAATSIITAVLLFIFYFIEKKAAEPIVPFEIFTKMNTIVNIISFMISAVLIGADVYMPIYIQNILGFGATISGLSLAPMSVAWLLSSVILAKAIPKYGERLVIALSSLILLISCAFLLLLGVKSSLISVIIYSFIMGFGFGGAFTTLTIVVQESVGYEKRGAATASNSLVRTLGQTIGVSIFGGLFNSRIVDYFTALGFRGIDPNSLYSASVLKSGITIEQIKASVNSGLHLVYVVFMLLSVLSLVLSLTLGSGLKEKAVSD
ncbi:MAG: MDR family MFS transporter [Caulobacteraceae bacterium]